MLSAPLLFQAACVLSNEKSLRERPLTGAHHRLQALPRNRVAMTDCSRQWNLLMTDVVKGQKVSAIVIQPGLRRKVSAGVVLAYLLRLGLISDGVKGIDPVTSADVSDGSPEKRAPAVLEL
jgi:hypothetical protein